MADYLGLVVDEQGLHASLKTIAVLNAPQPHNVKVISGDDELYRNFIPNLATVLKPLTYLLQKNCRWFWKAKQAEAFVEAKRLLTMAPVLVHYDPSLYPLDWLLMLQHTR